MARTNNLSNYLTDVAAAIKEKRGISSNIAANKFDDEIRNISTGITNQINGQQYKFKVQNSSIKSGDFVAWDQKDFNITSDSINNTTLSGRTIFSGYPMWHEVMKTDNHLVMVSHQNNGSYYDLYIYLCSYTNNKYIVDTYFKFQNSLDLSGLGILSTFIIDNNNVSVITKERYGKITQFIFNIDFINKTITKTAETIIKTGHYFNGIRYFQINNKVSILFTSYSSAIGDYKAGTSITLIYLDNNNQAIFNDIKLLSSETGYISSEALMEKVSSNKILILSKKESSSNNYRYTSFFVEIDFQNNTINFTTPTMLFTVQTSNMYNSYAGYYCAECFFKVSKYDFTYLAVLCDNSYYYPWTKLATVEFDDNNNFTIISNPEKKQLTTIHPPYVNQGLFLPIDDFRIIEIGRDNNGNTLNAYANLLEISGSDVSYISATQILSHAQYFWLPYNDLLIYRNDNGNTYYSCHLNMQDNYTVKTAKTTFSAIGIATEDKNSGEILIITPPSN